MQQTGRWRFVGILIAAVLLVAAASRAGSNGASADSPPSAPVVSGGDADNGQHPSEPMRPIVPQDDLQPGNGENLAEDGSQSQPASSSSTAASGSQSSGTVLASDNFSSAASGLLPTSSSRPNYWKVGYVNGEYQMASTITTTNASDVALINGTYGNVSISANARVALQVDSTPNQSVRLYCRYQSDGSGFRGYRFQFSPSINAWGVYRGDGNSGYSLSAVQYLPGPPDVTATHNLGLSCSGSTIAASIDGKVVGTYQDASYSTGRAALGVGNFTSLDLWGLFPPGFGYPGTYDARFTKLVLSQP